MRHLKRKLWQANRKKKSSLIIPFDFNCSKLSLVSDIKNMVLSKQKTAKRARGPNSKQISPDTYLMRATKNIAKNFGQAICSFIQHPCASEYLLAKIPSFDVTMESFLEFVKIKRPTIKGVDGLKAVLMTDIREEKEIVGCKALF
eukprot:CAMPEP_0114595050 /NCGR_PEP_ID=MMETSP0125-20121206/16776_1 /TAXON_ID=485358 ORGANISM="Aristerostoma sp., Strain ATCC 50986" /NCGR_SAMPLE_ID=MMETSP0125 /ASSEMBLY_ACC=CAM_ASM_000245 /LENGTH=144 /DNA_ID=CAMNT_0001796105 /DNA_START=6 /DNA_END=440 /DNA_ORIENTATION=-